MAIDSRFIYPRSIQRDVAATINSVRQLVPYEHQGTLDLLVRELVDTFSTHDPRTDADDFCTRAGFGVYQPEQGEQDE